MLPASNQVNLPTRVNTYYYLLSESLQTSPMKFKNYSYLPNQIEESGFCDTRANLQYVRQLGMITLSPGSLTALNMGVDPKRSNPDYSKQWEPQNEHTQYPVLSFQPSRT